MNLRRHTLEQQRYGCAVQAGIDTFFYYCGIPKIVLVLPAEDDQFEDAAEELSARSQSVSSSRSDMFQDAESSPGSPSKAVRPVLKITTIDGFHKLLLAYYVVFQLSGHTMGSSKAAPPTASLSRVFLTL